MNKTSPGGQKHPPMAVYVGLCPSNRQFHRRTYLDIDGHRWILSECPYDAKRGARVALHISPLSPPNANQKQTGNRPFHTLQLVRFALDVTSSSLCEPKPMNKALYNNLKARPFAFLSFVDAFFFQEGESKSCKKVYSI